MRPGIGIWLWGVVFCACVGTAAQQDSQRETKASFLMNFAEFVEWPAGAFADAKAPIILGIMGDVPFAAELGQLEGRMVNGRNWQIKRFKGALEFRGEEAPGRRRDELMAKRARKLRELKSCHILFIGPSEKDYLPMILKPLREESILTVGENESFTRQGGIINFLTEAGRIELEINLIAAERARLKISSKLLSLAKVKVERENEPN